MMTFWPKDIIADEILPPKEVMQKAGDELHERASRLSVSIAETRLEDRVVLAFEVTDAESGTTLNLFEVSHQLTEFYPLLIDPPDQKTPEFLKRHRYVAGMAGIFAGPGSMRAMTEGTPGKFVENKWVCATPSEFATKLIQLFADDSIKSRIVSLLAQPKRQDEPQVQSDGTETDQA